MFEYSTTLIEAGIITEATTRVFQDNTGRRKKMKMDLFSCEGQRQRCSPSARIDRSSGQEAQKRKR